MSNPAGSVFISSKSLQLRNGILGKYIPLYQVHFSLPKYIHNAENVVNFIVWASATSLTLKYLTFNKHGWTSFNELLYAHLILYLKQAKFCPT